MTDLHERAAALLAAADKMTPQHWAHYDDRGSTERQEIAALGVTVARCYAGNPNGVADAAGIVALRNEAPALIRELLVEYFASDAQIRMAKEEVERLRARVEELEESLHMANGTADLAMKHRDMAEKRVAELEAANKRVGFQFPQLDMNGKCLVCGKQHGNLPCPMNAATSAVDPAIAPQPYSTSDAGPTPFQGRTTRRNEE